MTKYIFTPPYAEEHASNPGHRLFVYLLKIRNGISIAKANGVYFQDRYPAQDNINTYQEFYAGGHEHIVTDATKAALISAGIGITESNFKVGW
jgi:hypothetical protein